jgi:peptidoglycan hydrolase-like protein with peptidoglycan-binding domain
MKQKLFLTLAGLLVAMVMLIPSVGSAQSATSTASLSAISGLLAQIQALQTQINALKATQNTLKSETATQIGSFVKNLSLGSRGDDVKALQALLATNSNIYPEGTITGYYGRLTEQAVRRFQKENGIEQAGRVGPKTLKILNKLLDKNPLALEDDDDDDDNDRGERKGEGKRPCAIVPPGHLIAPGWLKKNNGEKSIVPPCQVLPKGIEKKDGIWKPGTTTPSYMVPMINMITATSTPNTVSVSWTSNKMTTSTFWFSSTTPLNILTADKVDFTASNTAFTHSKTGLTASTTYYYMIRVSDLQNSATSTERTITTQ